MTAESNPSQTLDQRAPELAGKHLAIVGTGTMGSAAAHRLLGAGATLEVWNRSAEAAAKLGALGAIVHEQPQQAVAEAPVVLTFLPTPDVVREVMIESGVVAAMAPAAIWAQMGTIGIEATTGLHRAVSEIRPDVLFVDAPVSGSRGPAEAGLLVVLASGPEATRNTLDPIFSVLGHRTLWLGEAGAGTKMKLVLNAWLAFEVEAAAEAAALAAHFGIAEDVLTDALSGSPLVSPFAATKLAKIEAKDDEADFSLAWALKDLELAEAAAGPAVAPVVAAIAHRWRELVERGFGNLDVSAARLALGEEPDGATRPH